MISFQPKFSGEVQQRVFQNYLESFPPRSLARLNRIDQIPEHNPQHIRVAQQLGTQDPNIAFMMGKLKVKGSMGLAMKLNGILED